MITTTKKALETAVIDAMLRYDNIGLHNIATPLEHLTWFNVPDFATVGELKDFLLDMFEESVAKQPYLKQFPKEQTVDRIVLICSAISLANELTRRGV